MEETVRLITQYLHVVSAILWLGGGYYTIFVQSPALMEAPAAARGAVLAAIAPRQLFYLMRLGEFTLLTGFLRIITSPHARELESLSTRWSVAILIGIVLTVALLGIAHAVLKPAVEKMLTAGPKAAEGDAAAGVAVAKAGARLKTIGYVQLVLGAIIILGMVSARLS